MRPLHVHAVVMVGAVALAVLAAGCGGAIPSSNGTAATVKLTTSNSRFLVDAQGHTLYLFEKDEKGDSYCSGACAAVWPPFETSSMPHAAPGVDAAALGRIKRDNGDMQVTYHGHPLYYYAADASTPGRTRGEDVAQFGAGWYLVNAAGRPVEPKSGSPSNSHGGSKHQGGGYR